MIWVDLLYNLAMLIALSVVSGFVDMRWKRSTWAGSCLQGVVFGSAAVIGMLRPFVMGPGLIFDGRSVMISLGALFFGPWAGAVACGMTIPLRVLQGGPGMWMGMVVILLSAGIGTVFHWARHGRQGQISVLALLLFGLSVHAGMLAMTVFLPSEMVMTVLKKIALPVMMIYPLATVLIGKILSDQAAQDQLLASLREERERLAGILRGTNVGTWEWNVQTDGLLVNERWAEITGRTLAEISPVTIETWKKLTHPEDLKASNELMERHFRGELDYYELELRMWHKEERWVWILDRGRVTSWTPDGKPLMVMGTHQDITERKRAEEERMRLEADLQQAQKMESVGRLAGGVAHDFNNILTVILGHVQMAIDQVDPSQEIHSDLTEIQKAAERSADLTRQLLAFARKQSIVPKVLDLSKILEGLVPMLRRLIGESISLVWQPNGELWPVQMDPSQVDQILVNLCANARDSISGVGKIEIQLENVRFDDAYCDDHAGFHAGEFIRLRVRDNGRGMDQETMGHIFEPFFTTKGIGEGTGLGLATIYGIVKQNKGFIHVQSQLGEGTEFHIFLPRYAGEGESSTVQGASAAVMKGSETILLVEDEGTILDMTAKMIRQMGYTVLPASSPDEALRIAREYAGTIHLLVTDVVMPDMNGRDLARNLTRLRPAIQRLFMSGYTADVIAHNGMLLGGVNFIQKPFSSHDLSRKIREVLDASGAEIDSLVQP